MASETEKKDEKVVAVVVGDVVRLKSGGPMMTVTWAPDVVSDRGCERFNERGKLHEFVFPAAALEVLTKFEPMQGCGGGAGVPWDMPLVLFVSPRTPATSPSESMPAVEKPADPA